MQRFAPELSLDTEESWSEARDDLGKGERVLSLS